VQARALSLSPQLASPYIQAAKIQKAVGLSMGKRELLLCTTIAIAVSEF
jgi:hypothetical protein